MYLSLVLMEKIRLIKTVSDFAKDQLGLESDFEPWNIFDVKEKYYLYASEKNFIQVPENFGWNSQGVKYPFEYFGTDFEKAKKRESVFKRNFSTLLFSANICEYKGDFWSFSLIVSTSPILKNVEGMLCFLPLRRRWL